MKFENHKFIDITIPEITPEMIIKFIALNNFIDSHLLGCASLRITSLYTL